MDQIMDEKSNGINAVAVNNVIKNHRHSLQHKPTEIPLGSFRHTQSHRYTSDVKKKHKKATVIPPTQSVIVEGSENDSDNSPQRKPERNYKKSESNIFTVENEKRVSRGSRNGEKLSFAYDNAAYDSSLDKRSISSRAGSSRQPSVQSLEVVREQYCCCAKRTKCEKRLLLTVTVLSIVIVVLVTVLAVVASDGKIKNNINEFAKTFKN